MSLVSLAKNIVAVSLLGANVNSSAANKATSPLEGLAKSDFVKVSNLLGSQYSQDFESLVKLLPCDYQTKEGTSSQNLGNIDHGTPKLNTQVYKSKRGSKLIVKYTKFAQRREDLVIAKNKKRHMVCKLSKITKLISKNRPHAFELYSIKEESF